MLLHHRSAPRLCATGRLQLHPTARQSNETDSICALPTRLRGFIPGDLRSFRLRPFVPPRLAFQLRGGFEPDRPLQLACESRQRLRRLLPAVRAEMIATMIVTGASDRVTGMQHRCLQSIPGACMLRTLSACQMQTALYCEAALNGWRWTATGRLRI